MSRIIDKLVNVNISIAQSAANPDSFNKLLLVVDKPEIEKPKQYAEYTAIDQIKEAGFEETSEIYKAANIAFANGASVIAVALRELEESVSDALDKAFAAGSWYGFALIGYEETEYKNAAAWAEANEKLFGFTTEKTSNPLEGVYFNTHGWYAKDLSNSDNKYTHIAVMAKNFTFEAGEETWAYKSLSIITPVSLTATERDTIEKAGLNYYVECAGKNITYPGKTVGGEWIDVIRGKAWLQSDMQNRVYNLFIRNAKVPYTSKGIALIENQMISSLKQAQANGLVAEDETDADGNLIEGFSVTVPVVSDTTDAERATRNLSNCKFTARLSGAIHIVEIKGTLVA